MSEKLFKIPPETPEQRIVAEVWFMLIILIAVAFFGQAAAYNVIFTIILTLIFGINIVLRFILINEKGDWMFFLFGVIGGGGNDLMSMINGVYNYTSITIIPLLNGLLPLWMILFWGQIILLFRKIFNLTWFQGDRFQKDGEFLKGWVDKKLIVDIILLICLRFIIYNTYKLEFWIPALFYGIGIGVRFLIFPPKKNELLIIGILPYAFCFEGLMVVFGLYVYYHPVFLGMPLWLFLWWIFLVPIFVKEIFDRIEYYLQLKEEK
ncbi:MAG: hypothetical protein EU544_01055 [Promethearchaeota archaeon]|nr:MAG: hypothetical protein EU544_01055 [Candidatus Lokiarchaeota archaeon]